MMSPDDLSHSEYTTISVIERSCSALSLLGSTFIVVTFLGSTAFRKPINRLVCYACIGNVFTNVATLIARSAIPHTSSFLCQFQGFLIQMFMPADACWAFAMALNIWLTFYWKYDAERIRRLEKYYFLACYGIPSIPAFVFIFIQTQSRGRIYGNAVSWCWVSGRWDLLRLVTFYGPVWVIIGLTIGIYLRAGRDIYLNRKRLLRISNDHSTSHVSTMDNQFHASKTTEISFISESVDRTTETVMTEVGIPGSQTTNPSLAARSPYSVMVSGPEQRPQFDIGDAPINHPQAGNFEMSQTVSFPAHGTQHTHESTGRRAVTQTDNANWAYTKVAALFFVGLMVTWIPSSANRVYSYVHPRQISLGLEYASAFVLPLQGFWNGIIYTTTSIPACKSFWKELKGRKFSAQPLRRVGTSFSLNKNSTCGSSSSRKGMFAEIDSLTTMESRPNSNNLRPETAR